MKKTIYPVIMVGGAGTRLWPVSTVQEPKQFHSLMSDNSLFQDTLLRTQGEYNDITLAPPIIVGASRYREIIDRQLASLKVAPKGIFLEPCPRSTTPVAAISSYFVDQEDKDALILLLPSDHFISDNNKFMSAVSQSVDIASSGWITTFGVQPTSPETGYGYITAGEKLSPGLNKVLAFTEKPNLKTASAYIRSRNYSWNAGIFLFSPQVMLKELSKLAPETLENSIAAFKNALQQDKTFFLDKSPFEACENISLDYSVMEKTKRAAVFNPLSCGWSDVGTWTAISNLKPQTLNSNIASIDNEDCFFSADKGTKIIASGLKGLIIIAYAGSILAIPKTKSQNVGKLLKYLEAHDARLD